MKSGKCGLSYSLFFSSPDAQKEAVKAKSESKENSDEEMEVENGKKEAASEVKV